MESADEDRRGEEERRRGFFALLSSRMFAESGVAETRPEWRASGRECGVRERGAEKRGIGK